MSMEWTEAGIETICGGKVVAKVNDAMKDVFKNIHDPNTDPKVKRSLTLKMVFKPNHDRTEADITFEVDKKLVTDASGADSVKFTNTGKGFVQEAEQLPLDINAVEEEDFDPETGEVFEMNGTDSKKGPQA